MSAHKEGLLPLEAYPFKASDIMRFSDTDKVGHINNISYATYYETGRVAFFHKGPASLFGEGTQIVIANISINFLRELNWPGEVVIGTGITRIGSASFHLMQGIFEKKSDGSYGPCASTAQSVLVLMDVKTRKSVPLSEKTRQELQLIMLGTD